MNLRKHNLLLQHFEQWRSLRSKNWNLDGFVDRIQLGNLNKIKIIVD